MAINQKNVGRIAERILANELEYRGFRVSDLNVARTAANADLLAVRNGRAWQIQVKSSTEDNSWWFGYGYCTDTIIAKAEPMFNRVSDGFYKAERVALVSVKSPHEYSCVVLPTLAAEQAAQLNLEREYRSKKRDGDVRKPGKVWISLDYIPKTSVGSKRESIPKEIEILMPYRDRWDFDCNLLTE